MKKYISLLIICIIILQCAIPLAAAENIKNDLFSYRMNKDNNSEIISLLDYSAWYSGENCHSGNIHLKNEYLDISICKDCGVFTAGAMEKGDYKDILYGYPSAHYQNTYIKLDDETFIFMPSEVELFGDKCVAIQKNKDIIIRQILEFTNNPNTGNKDNLEIRYEVENTGSKSINVGVKTMIDTKLGKSFRIPGYGECTKEMEFIGDEIPQSWQSYDDIINPNIIINGVFYKDNANKPSKVQFTHWGADIYSFDDYAIDENRNLNYGSAVVFIYFDQTAVDSNTKKNFTTEYGLSDFGISDTTPPIGVGVVAPKKLDVNDDMTGYTPNPVNIIAYAENLSDVDVKNVTLKLILPNDLKLINGQENTINIGTLNSGAYNNVSWYVDVPTLKSKKIYDYSVIISSDGIEDKILNLSLEVPACEKKYLDIGDYFYLGKFNDKKIIWRCIDINEKGYLMLADSILSYMQFDDNSNLWLSSKIRDWLNDSEKGFLSEFTADELNVMKHTSNYEVITKNYLSDDAIISGSGIYIANKISNIGNYDTSKAVLTTDTVFLPSVKDMNTIYNNSEKLGNGYYNAESVGYNDLAKMAYWLKTPFNKDNSSVSVCTINNSDSVCSESALSVDIGVRPEFYLDMNKAVIKSGYGTIYSPYSLDESKFIGGNSGYEIEDSGVYGGSRKNTSEKNTENTNILYKDIYYQGIFKDFPTLSSYGIKNPEMAKRAVENTISEIEKDNKISFDDRNVKNMLASFSEEAAGLAGVESIEGSDINIKADKVASLGEKSNKARELIKNVIGDKNIDLGRDLRTDVTFSTISTDGLNINFKSANDFGKVDYINVQSPFCKLSLNKNALGNNKDVKISVEYTDTKALKTGDNGINTISPENMAFKINSSDEIADGMYISIKPNKSESIDNLTIVNSKGEIVLNKYDYINQEMCAFVKSGETYYIEKLENYEPTPASYTDYLNNLGITPIVSTVNFKDIEELSANEKRTIEYLYKSGVLSGQSETKFGPNDILTRAEFTVFLLRATGQYNAKQKGNGGFSDVNGWSAPVVSRAKELGIISGFSNNTFRPDDNISKEQVYQILGQSYIVTKMGISIPDSEVSIQLDRFTDKDSIAAWAKSNVGLCSKRGIVTRNNNNTFLPKSGLKRIDAAIVIRNYFDDLPFKSRR